MSSVLFRYNVYRYICRLRGPMSSFLSGGKTVNKIGRRAERWTRTRSRCSACLQMSVESRLLYDDCCTCLMIEWFNQLTSPTVSVQQSTLNGQKIPITSFGL